MHHASWGWMIDTVPYRTHRSCFARDPSWPKTYTVHVPPGRPIPIQQCRTVMYLLVLQCITYLMRFIFHRGAVVHVFWSISCVYLCRRIERHVWRGASPLPMCSNKQIKQRLQDITLPLGGWQDGNMFTRTRRTLDGYDTIRYEDSAGKDWLNVGLFNPVAGTLRSKYVPDHLQGAILNIFRLPLNTVVVAGTYATDVLPTYQVYMIVSDHDLWWWKQGG